MFLLLCKCSDNVVTYPSFFKELLAPKLAPKLAPNRTKSGKKGKEWKGITYEITLIYRIMA